MFSTDCVISVWSRPFLLIVLATCAAAFANKITLELKTELKLNRLPEFYLHAAAKRDYRGLAGVERVRVCILALEHSREEFCSAQMQIQVKGLAWMRPENNEAFPRLLPFNSLQAYNLIKSLLKEKNVRILIWNLLAFQVIPMFGRTCHSSRQKES